MTGISKRAAVRIGGILTGAGVLFVGGVLVAAGPALADNGPHVSNVGNAAVGSTDGCAGCHRIHSGEVANYLLRGVSSETALCTSCHGSTGAGATTDVLDGMAFGSGVDHATGTAVGALRGGGFNQAMIDAAGATRGVGVGTSNGTSIDKSYNNIGVLGTAATSNSKHLVGVAGQTEWGNGQVSATSRPGGATTVELECASCHDPHGNYSYRILRPAGTTGASLQTTMPLGITSATKVVNPDWPTRFTYRYTSATDPSTKFVPGQQVVVTGNSNGAFNIGPGTVTAVSATTFDIGYQAADPGADGTGGAATLAFANNIKTASSNGTSATYTTFVNHNMLVGQKVTIAGVTPTSYNLPRATITATTNTTFTVTIPASSSLPSGTVYTSGGYVQNIPDAISTSATGNVNGKIYTQDNYWRADDHYYTGSFVSTTGTQTAFITNVSQWCSTCHTRYFTSSNSRRFDSGDAIFKFRHTAGSNSGEGQPNCIQCHVAHGSNAVMNGQYSSTLPMPGDTTPTADSRLLRVNNRGICNMCHADQ
jgi:predicted CXXCH cytochrome family protein